MTGFIIIAAILRTTTAALRGPFDNIRYPEYEPTPLNTPTDPHNAMEYILDDHPDKDTINAAKCMAEVSSVSYVDHCS